MFRTRYYFAHSNSFYLRTEKLSLLLLSPLLNTSPTPHRNQVRWREADRSVWFSESSSLSSVTQIRPYKSRGSGLTHSGDIFFTRTGAKNQLLLACCPRFFKCKQSQTSWSSATQSPILVQRLYSFWKWRVRLLAFLWHLPQEELHLGADMQRVCTPSMCFLVPTLHCLLK